MAPPPGTYTAVIVNYDQVDGQPYDDWGNGRVEFASPRPRTETGVKEAWMLTCERPDGQATTPQEVIVDRGELYSHLDTHVLFKLHWGGRGVKGDDWKKLLEEDFRPRLERMWAEADYLHPRALLGYFPCYSEGNEIVVLDPHTGEVRALASRRARADEGVAEEEAA